MYQDVNKRNPKIDFLITAVLAMFWLAGAAAWANGLTGLRWAVNTENWLDHSSICRSVLFCSVMTIVGNMSFSGRHRIQIKATSTLLWVLETARDPQDPLEAP